MEGKLWIGVDGMADFDEFGCHGIDGIAYITF
jgi:hypothetical protein